MKGKNKSGLLLIIFLIILIVVIFVVILTLEIMSLSLEEYKQDNTSSDLLQYNDPVENSIFPPNNTIEYTTQSLPEYSKEELVECDYGSFVNNSISITFNDSLSDARCLEIINELGGIVTYSTDLMKYYDIQLNNTFSTYDEITLYCKQVCNKYDEIQYVFPIIFYNIVDN